MSKPREIYVHRGCGGGVRYNGTVGIADPFPEFICLKCGWKWTCGKDGGPWAPLIAQATQAASFVPTDWSSGYTVYHDRLGFISSSDDGPSSDFGHGPAVRTHYLGLSRSTAERVAERLNTKHYPSSDRHGSCS